MITMDGIVILVVGIMIILEGIMILVKLHNLKNEISGISEYSIKSYIGLRLLCKLKCNDMDLDEFCDQYLDSYETMLNNIEEENIDEP